MSLASLSSSISLTTCNFKFGRAISNPSFFVRYHNYSCGFAKNNHTFFKSRTVSKPARNSTNDSYQTFDEESSINYDWEDQEDVDDIGSPWEGAVIYKRNPSITHVEYCTTLERLGLGKVSTEFSKSRASLMGLRVTKAVKDYPNGTPVQISIDVTRKKHKLRLDGIVRTVLSLGCNRCGEPAAETVFSNFSLLLTEEPVEEPETINIDLNFKDGSDNKDEDDDASIDWDDRLHFPPEVTEVDISKNIRDMLHLEITINAVCDPGCKGMCLKCGANLNTSSCSCSNEEAVKEKGYGPLGTLRKQMQQKGY